MTKFLFACAAFIASLLGGCTGMPGMHVKSQSPGFGLSVSESGELDYTMVSVTPELVRSLTITNVRKDTPIRGILRDSGPSSPPYRIGSQDVLRLFVWGHPDLTSQQSGPSDGSTPSVPAGFTVDEKGFVFIPLVGEVKAAGQTVRTLRDSIRARLKTLIPDPQVDVAVVAYRSQRVIVAGEVSAPGVLPLTDQPKRVADAISQAGGALSTADLSAVTLVRDGNSLQLNLERFYSEGDTRPNILLTDGDVLTVPDRTRNKIFVLGEVGNSPNTNRAHAYVMRRATVSLTEVLAEAGGLNPFSAAADHVYVVRKGPVTQTSIDAVPKPVVYHLDLSEPQALIMADEFLMQARDIVFVNATEPTRLGRFIRQFLPVLTTANSAGNVATAGVL